MQLTIENCKKMQTHPSLFNNYFSFTEPMIKAHAAVSAFWFENIVHSSIISIHVFKNFGYSWIFSVFTKSFWYISRSKER